MRNRLKIEMIENHQLQPNSLLLALFSKHKTKTVNFVISITLNAWKQIQGQEIENFKHLGINPSITTLGDVDKILSEIIGYYDP